MEANLGYTVKAYLKEGGGRVVEERREEEEKRTPGGTWRRSSLVGERSFPGGCYSGAEAGDSQRRKTLKEIATQDLGKCVEESLYKLTLLGTVLPLGSFTMKRPSRTGSRTI